MTLDYSSRPHRWVNGACSLCAMRSTWEGARYSCTGVDLDGAKQRAKQKTSKKARGTDYTSADRAARRRERLGADVIRALNREAKRASRERQRAEAQS